MYKGIPILLGAIGVVLLVVGGFMLRGSLELREGGHRVTGTVTRYTTSTSEGDASYTPVYAYTFRGQRHEYESPFGSDDRPIVGDQATFLVDPTDPSRAKPDTFFGLWLVPLLVGGAGIVATGICLESLVRRGRVRSRSAEPGESRTPSKRGPFI